MLTSREIRMILEALRVKEITLNRLEEAARRITGTVTP